MDEELCLKVNGTREKLRKETKNYSTLKKLVHCTGVNESQCLHKLCQTEMEQEDENDEMSVKDNFT